MLTRAREQLGDLPIAVEFRHPSWLEPRLRERVWAQLRDHGMTYVVADTPPGTHDESAAGAGGHDARSWPSFDCTGDEASSGVRAMRRSSRSTDTSTRPTSSRIGYVILELADQAERVHVVFNNCYANYGTTNALEMAAMIDDAATRGEATPRAGRTASRSGTSSSPTHSYRPGENSHTDLEHVAALHGDVLTERVDSVAE